MKILYIVNNVMPKLAEKTGLPSSASGSWLEDISYNLSNRSDVTLAIACVGGREYRKVEIENITYYLLPGNGKNMLFYTKKYEKLWKLINDDFKPDIVHLYGTEYSHGLSFIRANPKVKSIVSIQGLISKIKDVMFDELPKCFDFKYATLKERIKCNGIFARSILYKMNSKYEREIIERADYISTVNSWDYSFVKEVKPNAKVFPLQYNLREGFYSANKWDVEKINRYQIFCAPGGDPIKGLHILLKAVALVKKNYPEIKVIVPGFATVNGEIVANSGYKKYIKKLVKKLGVKDNILFRDRLSEKEMIENMLNSHLLVVPSAIEGTSLVLREGMYLGIPSIASFRGGMADFIADKVDGYLYDYKEYAYLALRIEEIFANDEGAKEISLKAIAKASSAHDREKNVRENIETYFKIFEESKDE